MPVVFAILPFFSTLLGGWAALRLRHRLHPFMAFAAGVLVATALVDLLPEASDLMGPDANPVLPGTVALAGFLVFSAMEAFVHRQTWEHQHNRSASRMDPREPHEHAEPSSRPSGAIGLVGPASLIVHSTLDGLAIGFAFRAGVGVGLLVALAVLAHDFADGMNVVTLSLAGGRRLDGARLLLVLDALAPPIGAAIGSFVGLQPFVLGCLLALFSGVFLAIGAGHLLPEAEHHQPGASPALVLLTALGAGVVLLVRSALG